MTRVCGPEPGNCRAIYWPEAPSFGVFWRLSRVRAEGGCWLRELNRVEWGIGWRTGGFEEREVSRPCTRRCADRQAEMCEHLGDYGRMFDGGDDLQGAAALGTVPMSISKTRLSSRAQLMRAGPEGWAVLR
jgi:hypothetical protein